MSLEAPSGAKWEVVCKMPAGQSQRSSLDKSSAELLEIAAKLQDPQGAKPVGEASKRVKVRGF